MVAKLTPLCIIIMIASMIGFTTENLWIWFRFGYFDNRGMLLPGLLGYGMAMILVYMVLGIPEKPVFFGRQLHFKNMLLSKLYYFLGAGVLVSIGEIVLGNFVEKSAGIVWWNYSTVPLHIGKYTSVPTSMGFALLITIFMGSIFPRLYKWAVSINTPVVQGIVLVLFLLFVGDYLYETWYMLSLRKIHKIWKIKLGTGALINYVRKLV